MPLLQNNNRTPIKNNNSRVAVDEPFRETIKPLEAPAPNLFGTIAQVVSETAPKMAKMVEEYNRKSDQIKTNNLQNDYLLDYNNLTKRYKQDYSRNPSEQITKQYNSDLDKLKNSYLKQTPMNYQNYFLKNINNIDKSTDLDFFRSQANLQHQMNLYTNRINDNIQNFKERIAVGDDEALAEQFITQDLLKQQMQEIYGVDDGEKLFRQYQKQITDAFLSTKLTNGDSETLNKAIDTIEQSPLKHTIDPKHLSNYKEQAKKLKQQEQEQQKIQEQINHIANSNSIYGAIITGTLTDYSDILTALEQTNSSERDKKLLLSIAGFSPKYLLDDKTVDNKTTAPSNKKATTIETLGELQKQIILLGDFDKKELSKEQNQQQLQDLFDKMDNIKYSIGYNIQNGNVNRAEAIKLLDQLNQYTATLQTAKIDKMTDKPWSIFDYKPMAELKDIEKRISGNYFRDKKQNELNETQIKMKDKIQNSIYGGYFDKANQMFQQIKQQNPEIRANNWMDYRSQYLNNDQREKFDKTAMVGVKENLLNNLNQPLPVEKAVYDKYSIDQRALLLDRAINMIETTEAENQLLEEINNI